MKILLVILLTGGLIVGVSGVSYANINKCLRAEIDCKKQIRCLEYFPDFYRAAKPRLMNECMKRKGYDRYYYHRAKCDY